MNNISKMSEGKLTYIDLFAGAGGLSEGFIRQGFTPIAHVEMNKFACETLKTRVAFHYLKKNNGFKRYISYLKKEINRDMLWKQVPIFEMDSVIQSEISKKTIDNIFESIDKRVKGKKVDVIIGGPPCQAYSVVGRARDPKGMTDDPRNYLYKYYVEFLNRYKPKMFVFENVPGILSAKNGDYFSKIIKAIKNAGYECQHELLNAKDFNVLQNRKRVIIIGWRKNIDFQFPKFDNIESEFTIKKDLFSNLPKLKPGDGLDVTYYNNKKSSYLKIFKIVSNNKDLNFTTQHKARPNNENDLQIYKIAIDRMIDEGKRLNYVDLPSKLKKHKNETIFTNRFQVVDPNSISHTVVAHISCDGHYYIYPDKNQVRSISIREAARIQSFPDDFFFEGGQTAAFKQIGNAVPPLMAEGIARKIKKYL
jgi:DNA (cytosine-5)-methyltransferase 1